MKRTLRYSNVDFVAEMSTEHMHFATKTCILQLKHTRGRISTEHIDFGDLKGGKLKGICSKIRLPSGVSSI